MPRAKSPAATKAYPRRLMHYGWVRDLPDPRDHTYDAPAKLLKALPARVDLRPKCPPAYHQGRLDSCTANAIGAALEFQWMHQKQKSFRPSRLFIYYNERVIERTVGRDAGAMLRTGIKSVAKWGAPPEYPHWPYLHYRFKTKPPRKVYAEASKHQALVYQSIPQELPSLRGCLAQGWPFVFGMAVRASLEGDAVRLSGRLNMPRSNEGDRGGHAVMAVGYEDAKKRFVLRNSWGSRWGMRGYFTIPYEYLLDPSLTANFWTIMLAE